VCDRIYFEICRVAHKRKSVGKSSVTKTENAYKT